MNETNRAAARNFFAAQAERIGMSRADISKAADVDPKTLRAFLSGERWPQRDKRSALSKSIGWPSDELDFIEQTGTHRPNIRAINRETREEIAWPAKPITWSAVDLTRRFTEATKFAELGSEHPDLAEPSRAFIDAAVHLWQRASELLTEGGDGDVARGSASNSAADSELSAAPDELPAAAKEGLIEEPGEFNT